MTTLASARTARLSFWAKMTIGISAFIVFAFGQWGLRGMVDYTHAPLLMHAHGSAMLAWLGLLVTQSLLVGRGGIGLHRTLGWTSAVMAPLVVVLSSLACMGAIATGRFPPFFTTAYFLALVHVEAVLFAILVAAAVARRNQPAWHKRLMLGSTVLLMEPALGRLLPMPFIMPWGEWLSMAIQLGVVALIARHDRRELGRVHPATVAAVIAVALSHVVVELLAITPAWIAFTTSITGA